MINKKNVAKKNNVFKEERGGERGYFFSFEDLNCFIFALLSHISGSADPAPQSRFQE